ncbi:MAG: hypothetical protein GF341_04855 [candidate division Zixibacteria bacterium]|nr:hypothetical protein [candidate division Zixibacteria bacterium]
MPNTDPHNWGLCASCRHAQTITTPKDSVFVQCGLSFSDDRFPKYPETPVLRCRGYTQQSSELN